MQKKGKKKKKLSKVAKLSSNCNFVFVYILDIDGGYTEWTEWTECTATCGGGTQKRSRSCTNPSPKNNGKSCIEQEQLGLPEETQDCNTQDCRKNITVILLYSSQSITRV